jgi:hypothetical protein
MNRYLSKFCIVVFLVIPCLLLLSICGIFVLKKILNRDTTANPSVTFTLYFDNGDVYYKESDVSEYIKFESNEIDLPTGTYVKTETGTAHILFPDNSFLSLDNNTSIQINIDGNNTTVNQLIGNTWHRVKKLTAEGEYTVETDNTLATVRGTKFAVEVSPDKLTKVMVIENEVSVSIAEFSGDKKVFAHAKIIKEGNMGENLMAYTTDTKKAQLPSNVHAIIVTPEILEEKIDDSFKSTQWYKKNLELDQEYNKIQDTSDLKQNIQEQILQKVQEIELKNKNDTIKTGPKIPANTSTVTTTTTQSGVAINQ